METLAEITCEALKTSASEYINLIEASTQLLASEKGHFGNLTIEGRFVKAKPSGESIVVGDLHGDLESLVYILKASKFMEKAAEDKDVFMIFLGDYGDRGVYYPEVY